jgi:hypothetical protein
MDKGVYKRIEDKLEKQDSKLDEQTKILVSIQVGVAKELSILKLAHQKLKHGVVALSVTLAFMIAIEYPKLYKIVKGVL